MTAPRDFRRIFKGLVMNPVAPDRVDFYDPGYLVVGGAKITRLTREDPRLEFPSAEFRDFGRNIIIPGLVDTHVHLPQFAIMGIGKGELMDWLNTYTYPEEARFADPHYAAKMAALFFDALVANGTTTAVIYSSVHEQATDHAFAAAQAKGVRAFIGKVMMDQNAPDALRERTEDSIAASLRLFEKWDGADRGRLRYVFTPRFAASCSMPLMKRVGKIAQERGAFVQSHLSENKDEIRWVRRLFPQIQSYAGVYDAAGLLNAQSIMAHCIHLTSGEIEMLARRQTKVVFCPYSNRSLRSGTMPYRNLKSAGLSISLGTDIAGGPSLSMLEQMGEAMKAAQIPHIEALYLATLGGAAALRLEKQIGSFARGKDADFVVAEAGRFRSPRHALMNLCRKPNNRRVVEVYVRGKLVYS